jgi:hypothetical protein
VRFASVPLLVAVIVCAARQKERPAVKLAADEEALVDLANKTREAEKLPTSPEPGRTASCPAPRPAIGPRGAHRRRRLADDLSAPQLGRARRLPVTTAVPA